MSPKRLPQRRGQKRLRVSFVLSEAERTDISKESGPRHRNRVEVLKAMGSGTSEEKSGKTMRNGLIIRRSPERANPGGFSMATKKKKKPLKKAKKLEETKPLTVALRSDFGRR